MAEQNNDLISIKGHKHKSHRVKTRDIVEADDKIDGQSKDKIEKSDDKSADKSNEKSDKLTDTESTVDSHHVNNWTDTNINTVRTWKKSLSQALYIYNEVVERLSRKLTRYRITNLIIGIITTLIQSISTYALANFTEMNNIYIALTISIITIIISAVTNFLNGMMQIYKLNETVTDYTLYIERLDHIYSTIANQLTLPSKVREDAFTFIKTQNEIYLKLIKESPNIPSSEYKNALDSYHKYIKDAKNSMKLASSYFNNDTVIEVV